MTAAKGQSGLIKQGRLTLGLSRYMIPSCGRDNCRSTRQMQYAGQVDVTDQHGWAGDGSVVKSAKSRYFSALGTDQ